MSATKDYIAKLSTYPLPTADELHDLCTALHAAIVEAPEMLWMTVSFEDMADVLTAAKRCIEAEDVAELADFRRRERRDAKAEQHFGA